MTDAPFDGQRFHNAAPHRVHSGGALRWLLTRRPPPWPARLDDPEVPLLALAEGEAAATYVGHSTFLLRLGGLALLTDPIWSRRAGPFGLAGPRRIRPPGLAMAALPAIGAVVVSHCHYDHLDLPSLRQIQARFAPVVVSGLGNARHLAKAGMGAATELDWWQSVGVGGARITYVPARHFSARTPFDRNRALWGGFVVEAGGRTVFFAGDTGYGPHLAEIGRRFPRLDLALLPIGAYAPRWMMQFHHMDPDEAVRAHLDLGARLSVAMHHGVFQLADEPFAEPEARLAAARRGERFVVLRPGASISF